MPIIMPRFRWGDNLNKILYASGPFDNPRTPPKVHGAVAVAQSGDWSSWHERDEQLLLASLRFIPRSEVDMGDRRVTGWAGTDGVREALRHMARKPFYLYEDDRNLFDSPELATVIGQQAAVDWTYSTNALANITSPSGIVEDSGVGYGRQKLLFTGSTGVGWVGVFQRVYGIKAGDVLTFSCDVEVVSSAGSGAARIWIQYQDDNNTSVGAGAGTGTGTVGSSRLSFQHTCPTGATRAWCLCYANSGASGSAVTAYFSNARVRFGPTSLDSNLFVPNYRHYARLRSFVDERLERETGGTHYKTDLEIVDLDGVEFTNY